MKRSQFLFAAVIAAGLCISSASRAGMITTTFAGNNNFTGNMFDVTTFGTALTINAVDVNVDTGSVPISVYYRPGTYVGHETSAAGWTLAGTVSVTGLGPGNMTFVDIPDFTLAANSVTGFYVTVDSNVNAAPFMYYTNGSNTFSNSDIRIDTGIAEGGLFGSLGVFTSRTWNGTIFYSESAVPEPASMVLLGIGVIGLTGVARLGKSKSR
jgi:hypothetical protein